MLEGNRDQSRRYAPPPQRTRSLNRRKSGGDRFEKVNFYANEVEKIQPSLSRNFPPTDHVEAGNNHVSENESSHTRLIPIDGCCSSDAAQLLNDRWSAAMHSCNDPSIDISERPVVYSGASGSSWGHLKLPHQMDFLAELRRAIQNDPAGRN